MIALGYMALMLAGVLAAGVACQLARGTFVERWLEAILPGPGDER